MKTEPPGRILIVDDEAEITQSLRICFELEGYEVETAQNGAQAVEAAKNNRFDLALVDIQLPDMRGEQLIEEIKAVSPGSSFIIMTGYASIESAMTAVGKDDILAYELKPFDVNHVVAVAKEIQQRKRVERLLREKEARGQAMFENMINAIAVFDASVEEGDFIFTDINKTSERIDKLDRAEIIGSKITEVLPGAAACGLLDLMKSVRLTGRTEYLPNVRYSDGRIDGWRSYCVFKLPAGDIVLVYEDITGRRESEQRVLEAKKEADLYIDLMTHDLTNFNQTLLGFLDLMGMQKTIPEKITSYIEKSRRQVKKTDNLISKVRSFSLAKNITPDSLVIVDLNQLILNASQSVRNLFKKKSINIKYQPREGLLAPGSELLETAFIDLLENAVRHSSNESPSIAVAVDVSDAGFFDIRFTDDGPGVPDSMKEKIFDRYQRMGVEKGMGLGLSLVRTIVERIGGSIRVEDVVRDGAIAGSVFILRIPRG